LSVIFGEKKGKAITQMSLKISLLPFDLAGFFSKVLLCYKTIFYKNTL